ncbi:MAG: YegP family protein [Clostridiaceae bacterium]
MAGKFVIREIKEGFLFDLKADNGQVILSSEIYTSLAACKNGIESVKTNAPIAQIEDQTIEGYVKEKNPKFEVYVYKSGEYRFRLNAKNGQVIGTGQRYKTKAGYQNGIESIKKNSVDAVIVEEKS